MGALFRTPERTYLRHAMTRLRRVPRPVRGGARVLVRLWYSSPTPKTRFLLLSLCSSLTLLVLAAARGVFAGPHPAIGYAGSPHARPGEVSLALLQDPAGLVVLTVVLITPVFCCQQVIAIGDFVRMNERNMEAMGLPVERREQLDRLTRKTNIWFGRLGGRGVSAVIMLTTAVATALLYGYVNDHGLMQTWNFTGLPDDTWRSRVYAGWWANWHTHPELALDLWAAGTYAFYFLTKQLAMGVIFTVHLRRSAALGFGVTPNMEFDSDGYQGLRTLRQFMLWTYGSALSHLTGLLALFVVWLPAAPSTLFVVLAVMVVDAVVVIYPSSIGYHFALAVKQAYVRSLHDNWTLAPAELDATTAQAWSTSVLPVATRRAMTGISLYLLVPAVIALLPAVVQR